MSQTLRFSLVDGDATVGHATLDGDELEYDNDVVRRVMAARVELFGPERAFKYFTGRANQSMKSALVEDVERADTDDDLDEEAVRAMALGGDEFEAYWTRGKGLKRWSLHPHPWRRLRGLLRKHPGIHDPEGLASTYFRKVFGIWPGERKGSNKAGPG